LAEPDSRWLRVFVTDGSRSGELVAIIWGVIAILVSFALFLFDAAG